MKSRLIGYASTLGYPAGEEVDDAQERELARAFGAQLVDVIRDRPEDGDTLGRPGLRRALWMLADDQADGLAVAKLERLTMSLGDLGDLLDWFNDADARLVVLEPDIDTARADGRKTVETLILVSGWQRRAISEKTHVGLASARARGKTIGRPAVPPELAERIRKLHVEEGWSLRRIANQLTEEGIPTARGAARWHVSAVQKAAGYERPKPRHRPELPPLKPKPRKLR